MRNTMTAQSRCLLQLGLLLLASVVLCACGGGSVETTFGSVRAAGGARRAALAPAISANTLHNMRAAHFTGNFGTNWDKMKSPEAIQAYLDYLRSSNVEWIGVSVAIFVDGVTDPTVRVHYRPAGTTSFAIYTFNDDDLVNFLTTARQQGFRLYLTLAIERNGPTGLADPACNTPSYVPDRWLFGRSIPNITLADLTCINPSDWWWDPQHPRHAANLAEFFRSYTDLASKYGAIAQAAGVEIYSLGTETDGLFRTRTMTHWPDNYLNELGAMMSAVRAVYSGWVTYDQHFPATVDTQTWNTQQFLFSDLGMDIVGISAYYSLSNVARLYTSTELEAMWRNVFSQYILPLQKRNPNIPIVFTEFGYTDDVSTVVLPKSGDMEPIGATGITDGMVQQSRVLAAFFKVNEEYGQPVRGSFLWAFWMLWETLCQNKGFHVYCKPAQTAVTDAYAGYAAKDADRVFDWAENAYSGYFPNHETSVDLYGYRARHYAPTGNYIGYKDGQIYVHNGRDWVLLNVGPLSSFLPRAAAAGF